MTGPFGYCVIGLGDGWRQVNTQVRGINNGGDVRQSSICLDNNAMRLCKLEKLGVFCVVIGVKVYLEVNVREYGVTNNVNPHKRWMNLVHCGNNLSGLKELAELFNIEVRYANTPVTPIPYQKVASPL